MAYIGKSPDGTGVRSRFYYTQSSGGGTSVSGSSDDGTSLAFSDGAYVDVFLNGVLLVAGTDYNTNTANTIAGLAALANGDVVEVVVYDIFTVADTVSALNGGTFAGNVNFSGNIDVDGTTTVDGLTSSEALDVTTSTHANASVFKSTGTTQLFLQDTDATSDDQFWGFQVSGGSLNILTCDDDRSGGFLTPIELTSTGVISHSISASGDIAKFVTSANSGTGLFLNSQTSNQIDVVGFDGSAANAVNIRSGGASGSGLNIDTSNKVLIGQTSYSNTSNVSGAQLAPDSPNVLGVNADLVLLVNRRTNDGNLISFQQDKSEEGSISVSGTTVSYNGGHLSRWSQATDGNRIDGLVKGTVMTNLDQMAKWHHEAQAATLYEDGDEIPEGKKVGDEKTPAVAAYDEDNEQLNCMAVSSVEGDANVAGVFVNWDDDDKAFTADMNVAMTGDMVIRIAKDTTVARGDLLMSAGDGTAKPQDDDIVRSKTIAKVTSTTKSHTYDDGTYLVPCVLMAC